MPIKPITAYFLQCDLCAEVLPHPNSEPGPHCLEPWLFLATHKARAAAAQANWTCSPLSIICPKCSPPVNPS